jgi:hypothetical protein
VHVLDWVAALEAATGEVRWARPLAQAPLAAGRVD